MTVNGDVELLVAERCAPLVEAIEKALTDYAMSPMARHNFRDALAAYRAAQGAGRETDG